MFEPSTQINALLTAAAVQPGASEGLNAMMQRQSEFPHQVAAQLTGIAMDPYGRAFVEQFLDDYWSDQTRRQYLLSGSNTDREVIIGGGFHAAVYAAVRVLSGHPRPLVLERHRRVGGTFAMTTRPTFYLNSRNRAGSLGMAGDQGASLNYLPGAPIQAANVSGAEFQDNTVMGFIIRLTLGQYADVVPDARVSAVTPDGDGVSIAIDDQPPLAAGRVIDARGLGDAIGRDLANGETIVTFPQFMQRMAGMWPLRGLGRVAVIGGGDSAKCAVESLLGIAPAPRMAATTLDRVKRIDWYADNVPTTCETWRKTMRSRYQAIGSYLRPDRQGTQRLAVIDRRVRPIALPGLGLIDGRTYDLVVLCIGNTETPIDGLEAGRFEDYQVPGGTAVVAREHFDLPAYRIGPHARLPFTSQERQDGIADIPANAASIFRTASKTAAFAATLPALSQPS